MKLKLMLLETLLLALLVGVAPLQARYLNPASGRFQTMDAYEGSPSEPASLHKYLYAHADPVNKTDPSGNETLGGLMTSMGSQMTAAANYSLRAGQAYMRVKSTVETIDAVREAYDIIETVLSEGVDGLDEDQSGLIENAVFDTLENLARRMVHNIILKKVPRVPVLGVVAGTSGGSSAGASQSAGHFLNNAWHKGTFPNKFQSVTYHMSKHGKGRTAQQYTQDAMSFYATNRHLGQRVILKDGTAGIKLQLRRADPATGRTIKIGGYWTEQGKLVTFWD